MIPAASPAASHAAKMRAAFDALFAAQPRAEAEHGEAYLAIGVAGAPYLMRLREVAGLYVDRAITPVPSGDRALLGIIGVRTAILPVFALRALLGLPPTIEAPRWLVTSSGAALAFAFDRFDGHLALPRDAVVPRGDAGTGPVRDAGVVGRDALPIVSLAELIAAAGA